MDNAKPVTKNNSKFIIFGFILLVALLIIVIYFTLPLFTKFISNFPCLGYNGFGCEVNLFDMVNQNSTINLGFEQTIASQIYNVSIACTSSDSNQSPPNTEFIYFGYMGETTNSGVVKITREYGVNNIQCYNSIGMPISNLTAGTVLNATIWANYTLPNSTIVIEKIAKVHTVVKGNSTMQT